jgi:hypothetical protein
MLYYLVLRNKWNINLFYCTINSIDN